VALFSGDDLFTYVMLGAKDLDASVEFYDAALVLEGHVCAEAYRALLAGPR
jgi:catechol 2,3-dioxygenase-like lactoylglutathione lyase family enzyme